MVIFHSANYVKNWRKWRNFAILPGPRMNKNTQLVLQNISLFYQCQSHIVSPFLQCISFFWWNRCFICETSQPHFGVPPFASVFWRLNVRSGCVIESPVWLIKANHFDCLNQHVPYISDLLLDSIDVFWVRFWDFASVRSMDFCSRSLVEKITRVAGISPAKTWNYLEELGFFRNRWEFTHNWGWLVVEATKTDDSNFKAEIF